MYNNHTNTKQQYQDFSTKIIVAITGAPEDVEADYWGFFNTNATDAGLHHFGEARVHWVTPTTAQFYTTRERLMNGLELRSINKLLQDNPDAYDSDDDVLPKDVLPVGFASKPKPEDEEIFDNKVEKVVQKVKETTKGTEIKVVKEEEPAKEEMK